MKTFLWLCIPFLLATEASSFATGKTDIHRQTISNGPSDLGRSDFFNVVAGGIAIGLMGAPTAAVAKDDGSKAGTKQDPAFETCVSKCIYECTKPKGAEQKSRKECLPECKQSCATTKAQLLVGEPKSG